MERDSRREQEPSPAPSVAGWLGPVSPRKRGASPAVVVSLLFVLSGLSLLASCGGGTSERGVDVADEGLVVYSPHPEDIIDFVVKEFRQRSGIRVRAVAGGTGELLARLRKESAAPQADVFWGGGVESLDGARDLFSPYRSPEGDSVPAEFKDPGGYWTGLSVLPTVILYNTRLVPRRAAPRSWKDLVGPYFRGRVAYADPARSGSAYTALVTMLIALSPPSSVAPGGALGSTVSWDYVSRLKRVAMGGVSIPESEAVFGGVAVGEWFAGISVEPSVLALMKKGSDVAVVYPEEGTSAVADGVAIVSGGSHRREAEAFVDFVLGADAQSVIAARWFRRSVRSDLPAPPGAPSLSEIPLVPYDRQVAAREKGRILSLWESIR